MTDNPLRDTFDSLYEEAGQDQTIERLGLNFWISVVIALLLLFTPILWLV